MSRRWLVERSKNVFEDVGAEHLLVQNCGALKFYDGTHREPENILLIAPGQWLTVCEEQE
jgi:hypothetical protein